MKIYHHWLHATAQRITEEDIRHICSLLQIPETLLNRYTAKSGTTVCSWKAPNTTDTEAVAIVIPAHALYGSITLRGSYFDAFPDCPVHELYRWITTVKNGSIKKVDISFEDTEQLLNFNELKAMCSLENYQDFLVGTCLSKRKKCRGEKPDSNNRSGVPDVHANHDLIHFGDVDSTLSAKAYVRPNGNVKIELTICDKNHNQALLALYDPETIGFWETRAKEALVQCVNFVKPSSRRSKRLVQVESWERFLGSPVKAIKWTDIQPTYDVEAVSLEQGLSRSIGQLQNLCRRFRLSDLVDDAIKDLQAKIIEAHDQLRSIQEAFV